MRRLRRPNSGHPHVPGASSLTPPTSPMASDVPVALEPPADQFMGSRETIAAQSGAGLWLANGPIRAPKSAQSKQLTMDCGTWRDTWRKISQVVIDGVCGLTPGDEVSFTYEALPQDEFSYRAVLVWPPGVRPGTPLRARHHVGSSTAYQSRLTIRWSDGTFTEGIPGKEAEATRCYLCRPMSIVEGRIERCPMQLRSVGAADDPSSVRARTMTCTRACIGSASTMSSNTAMPWIPMQTG